MCDAEISRRVSIHAAAARRADRCAQAHPHHGTGASIMTTLLITSQIVCYGVGIVSASLNIAAFVRRRRVRTRRRA
jgi:hypothetical protein